MKCLRIFYLLAAANKVKVNELWICNRLLEKTFMDDDVVLMNSSIIKNAKKPL